MAGGPGGEPDMAKMAQMFGGPGGPGAAGGMPALPDGQVPTPFGPVSKEALEAMQNDPKIKDNPKFQAIQEEVKTQGPMAIMKHMNDPDVMKAMTDFSKLFAQQQAAAQAGGGPAAVAGGEQQSGAD